MPEEPMPLGENYSAVVEGPPIIDARSVRETAFEKRRGILNVEVRSGFSQVHVHGLEAPLMAARIRVLDIVAAGDVSIDFLKLTPAGLSFMTHESDSEKVAEALRSMGAEFDVLERRHIVLVHAANMRDEEGLIADVMAHAIGSGVQLEHVTDMHNRMLMVVGADQSETLVRALDGLGGAS